MWLSINFLATKFHVFEGLLSDVVLKIYIKIEDFEQVMCTAYLIVNRNILKSKLVLYDCATGNFFKELFNINEEYTEM
jgi:hypothetical protein